MFALGLTTARGSLTKQEREKSRTVSEDREAIANALTQT